MGRWACSGEAIIWVGSKCDCGVDGVDGSDCCKGRTSEEERRLPSVFMVSAGRMFVEEARLRLGGGTASDMKWYDWKENRKLDKGISIMKLDRKFKEDPASYYDRK
jgi:hypothetical protein